MKRLFTTLLEVCSLGALVVGAFMLAVWAGWIVAGVAGLAYVRGLTR